jgi:hypothetical protein
MVGGMCIGGGGSVSLVVFPLYVPSVYHFEYHVQTCNTNITQFSEQQSKNKQIEKWIQNAFYSGRNGISTLSGKNAITWEPGNILSRGFFLKAH